MTGLTATEAAEKPATITDACRIVAELAPVAEMTGYILALYGSTVRVGRGKDIDLIAVPWRHAARPDDLVSAIAARGFTHVGKPHHGLMGTHAQVLVENATGLMVDLQVRECHRQTP